MLSVTTKSFVLSVTIKFFMLIVVMQHFSIYIYVILLSVVAPLKTLLKAQT
jgi:hypothetical protein